MPNPHDHGPGRGAAGTIRTKRARPDPGLAFLGHQGVPPSPRLPRRGPPDGWRAQPGRSTGRFTARPPCRTPVPGLVPGLRGSHCGNPEQPYLLRPADLDRSRRFYRDALGLAVYREFGPAADPSVVFFLGQGLLEVSGHGSGPSGGPVMIWLQVGDVRAEHGRLAAAGVRVLPGASRGALGPDRDVDRGPRWRTRSSSSKYPPTIHCAATSDNALAPPPPAA